ncbi:MAG TPA: OmpH family outer membrane protein [Caulobacteraceae bacterium]
MTPRNLIAAGAGSLLILGSSSAATAQAAAPPIAQGPAIPGVCVIAVNQAIGASAVGRYANQRMEQIVAQVKAELAPEDTAISNEGRTLQTARGTLDAPTFQTRANALQARITAFRTKADLRQREVQATEQKSLNRIAQELDPIARQLYQSHRCSILLDKQAVMMANPAMDLTTEAVTGLNARIQQFAFDREHLDNAPAPTGR